MLDKSLKATDWMARRLIWFGGALLIGAAVLVTIDVFARKLFNVSMAGSDELSGYAFGVSTMLALSATILDRSHIRVDAFYQKFPPRIRVLADVVGLAALTGFLALVAWLGTNLLADSIEHGSQSITPMRTPLAIPQSAWVLGLWFAVLTGVLVLLATLRAAAQGDFAAANRLAGIKSVDEQIDEETDHTLVKR